MESFGDASKTTSTVSFHLPLRPLLGFVFSLIA